MKRGVSIAMVMATLTYIIISLFPALKLAQLFLMNAFIIVLAAALLYGLFSLFYHSVSIIGDGGNMGWHGFFMFLGFLTLPILLIIAHNTTWFTKSELLFSHPNILPTIVELEMDKNDYMVKMPLKKEAILIISQMVDNSWNPPANLLEKSTISQKELRELVPQNEGPHQKEIDILFAQGDANLFIETALKASLTFNTIVRQVVQSNVSQAECSAFENSPKAEKVYTQLQQYKISPSRAVIRTVMRTIIYPLQTTFFALLLFYLLVSILTFRTDKKVVVLLFLGTAVMTLLTQLPLALPSPLNRAATTLEYVLLLPTISVFRAILLSAGVAFLLYLFYVLSIVIKGRSQ